MDNFKQIFPRLDQLKADIEQANNLAAEMATDAYNEVNTDIDQLRRELDQSQALDLRWAIFGLYIATIDVALGCWA